MIRKQSTIDYKNPSRPKIVYKHRSLCSVQKFNTSQQFINATRYQNQTTKKKIILKCIFRHVIRHHAFKNIPHRNSIIVM